MPTTLTMVNESGHESLSSPSIHRSQPATNHSKIWLSGLFVVRNCSNSKGWSGSLILIKTGHVPAEMMFKPKCEIKENNCVHQILYTRKMPHQHQGKAEASTSHLFPPTVGLQHMQKWSLIYLFCPRGLLVQPKHKWAAKKIPFRGILLGCRCWVCHLNCYPGCNEKWEFGGP